MLGKHVPMIRQFGPCVQIPIDLRICGYTGWSPYLLCLCRCCVHAGFAAMDQVPITSGKLRRFLALEPAEVKKCRDRLSAAIDYQDATGQWKARFAALPLETKNKLVCFYREDPQGCKEWLEKHWEFDFTELVCNLDQRDRNGSLIARILLVIVMLPTYLPPDGPIASCIGDLKAKPRWEDRGLCGNRNTWFWLRKMHIFGTIVFTISFFCLCLDNNWWQTACGVHIGIADDRCGVLFFSLACA